MKKINVTTECRKMLADLYTPVGIYLRLRDQFRDTILLESADSHVYESSHSIIGINAIAGFEVKNGKTMECKFPLQDAFEKPVSKETSMTDELWSFMQQFEVNADIPKAAKMAQSMFGYITHDAVQFFDTIQFHHSGSPDNPSIPLIRYRLYQYVIVINHFKNELYFCENKIPGLESESGLIESLIKSRDVPSFPFQLKQEEVPDITDDEYLEMVKKGIASCKRGDVFQIVLSRNFHRRFSGDEFNVYRALRSINPSPYLFYFDYGDYRLFGSSPESQVILTGNVAVIHPIAGTFRRTGVDEKDRELAEALKKDKKENAEHVMLVDLARNDLGITCDDVEVSKFCQVEFFSHVIHLVSEVKARLRKGINPVKLIATTFPAGTLSGAPKYKALQLIDEYEHNSRGFYGGCLGYIGFDGSSNHAITIRTFLSKENELHYRAGAGITVLSDPQKELQEVRNKLAALAAALNQAQTTTHENITVG